MSAEIIPTLLTNEADLAIQHLAYLDKAKIPAVQIDVMDQTFVANTSWHDPEEFSLHDFSLQAILHLMIQDPETEIKKWLPKNIKRVLWHLEAPVNHERLLSICKKQNLEVGLAVSPGTHIRALLPYIDKLDEALILGVHPGWSGQTLIPSTVKKIGELKKMAPGLRIGFDGGIRVSNIARLNQEGATRFYVDPFKGSDPMSHLKQMTSALKRGTL
ncbi:MAG TPA: hypothetical protein VFQ60_01075 [Patescibacteria group bacterium]|nr:hypothetical protein [Patescibacteria group bacterium]